MVLVICSGLVVVEYRTDDIDGGLKDLGKVRKVR